MIFNKDVRDGLAPPTSREGQRRIAEWSARLAAQHRARVDGKRAAKQARSGDISRTRAYRFGQAVGEWSHAGTLFLVLAIVTDKFWLAVTAALALWYIKRAERLHHEKESNHG